MEPTIMAWPCAGALTSPATIFLKLSHGVVASTSSRVTMEMAIGIYLLVGRPLRFSASQEKPTRSLFTPETTHLFSGLTTHGSTPLPPLAQLHPHPHIT